MHNPSIEARDDGWQWNQLDHMQIICTTLQITTPVPQQSNKVSITITGNMSI